MRRYTRLIREGFQVTRSNRIISAFLPAFRVPVRSSVSVAFAAAYVADTNEASFPFCACIPCLKTRVLRDITR